MSSGEMRRPSWGAIGEAIAADRARFFAVFDSPEHAAIIRQFRRERTRPREYTVIMRRSIAHWHRVNAKRPLGDHWLFGPHFTPADVIARFVAQQAQCEWCGVTLAVGYQIDHVVPLAASLNNSPENIVLSCRSCNRERNGLNRKRPRVESDGT